MPNWKALSPTSRHEFNIAIVCVNPPEYDAICILLDGFWDKEGDLFGRAQGDPNIYTTGHIGAFNIVVVLLYNSGSAIAASAVASLRSSYPRLELLLLTGTCDCVPAAKHLVDMEPMQGDVIIGDIVIQYELGNIYSDRFGVNATLENCTSRANKNVRSFIKMMNTELWNQRLAKKTSAHLQKIQDHSSQPRSSRRQKKTSYEYPGLENDVLFEPTYCHKHHGPSQCECINHVNIGDPVCYNSREQSCAQTGCESTHRIRRNYTSEAEARHGQQEIVQEPRIIFGKFGSGDSVIRSGIIRDRIAEKYEITAFEVEGAGVWDELPCIIVKGVSGYGDGHRTDSWSKWQSFAAATSASAAKSLIESYIQTEKSSTSVALDQANLECLRDLFITNPRDDKIRIEETKGGLLVDAYKWILDNDAYNRWWEGNENLLWIKGDPGKGKTMLLCGIIDELEKISSHSTYYFFCQATDSRLDNATAILRGLLYMMIKRQPQLISYVRAEYSQYGKSLFEDSNSFIALSRIFCNILENATMDGDSQATESIIIIDALDECKTDLPQLLDLVMRCASVHTEIKWILSSRNEQDIQEALARAENKSTISLELNKESVATAISSYIRYKVQSLAGVKGYNDALRHDIEDCLSINADGTFLWVALVCTQLRKVASIDARRIAAAFPPGLDQFYNRMMQKIIALSPLDLGRKVLSIAAVVRRPLTVREFVPFIDAEDHRDASDFDWDNILGYCGSFLTLRHDTIYFIHQSASDFLAGQASNRLFPDGLGYFNRYIFQKSVSAMSQVLGSRDMYGLSKPDASTNDLKEDPFNSGPLAPVAYCCVYWIDHFEQAFSGILSTADSTKENYELITRFLREKYIYWLEALSLLRSIFDGMAAMETLERLVGSAQAPNLHKLVWDNHRFIQMFSKVIADFPLQVYGSGLLFSPKYSITRQCFEAEAPSCIQLWSDGRKGWDQCLRRFEGHKDLINRLAISACGTWLASSAWDGTIKVWEASTGRLILSIRPYNRKPGDFSFSTSTDNELAYSSFEKCEVIIIDVTTAKILQRINPREMNGRFKISYLSYIKEDLLGCLSFVPLDKNTLHYISTWNTKTGERVKFIEIDLPGRKNSKFIKFSPKDSNVVAIAQTFSSNPDKFKTEIKICHLDTYNKIHTIQRFKCPEILNTKFSPNGDLLVAHNRSVTMYDIATGGIKWAVVVNNGLSLPRLAFSADGRCAISGFLRTPYKIEIWDTISGICLHKIKDNLGPMAFPLEEGGQNIFASNGLSINLIDLGTQQLLTPALDGENIKIPLVTYLALSPDGRKLTTYSQRHARTIQISDTCSNKTTGIKKMLEHAPLISSFVFSPDSKKLAFICGESRCNILEVWDTSSDAGHLVFCQNLEERRSRVGSYSMIFSSDSQRLAVADNGESRGRESRKRKIVVWDISSFRQLIHLQRVDEYPKEDEDNSEHDEGDSEYDEDSEYDDHNSFLLAFSLDKRYLAISWIYASEAVIKMEIWDIASGTEIGAKTLCQADLNISPSLRETKSARLYELSFMDDGDVILDLYYCRNIRVVLRTKATNSGLQLPRYRKEMCYSIDPSNCWITLRGEKILWIPPELRCVESYIWDSQTNCLAIYEPYGKRLSVFKFCCSSCPKQIFTRDYTTARIACSPDKQIFTYARELDDWQIQGFDMDPPEHFFTIIHKGGPDIPLPQEEHITRVSRVSRVAHRIQKVHSKVTRFWK